MIYVWVINALLISKLHNHFLTGMHPEVGLAKNIGKNHWDTPPRSESSFGDAQWCLQVCLSSLTSEFYHIFYRTVAWK